MARPKTFDKREALLAAMDLFWRKGYRGASMQELVETMGIGRASLYDTFGSKRKLFGAVLELYGERMREHLAPLRRPGPAKRLIGEFLRSVAAPCAKRAPHCCLVVKTAALSDPPDAEIASCCRDLARRVEEAFYALLIREGTPRPRAMARFFAHSTRALGISAAIRPDKRILDDIVKTTISVLE